MEPKNRPIKKVLVEGKFNIVKLFIDGKLINSVEKLNPRRMKVRLVCFAKGK